MVCLVSAAGFAQSPGAAIFKAHCQVCHGAGGIPNPALERLLGVLPVTSPEMKQLTPKEMFSAVQNGKGKMPGWKSKLMDAQISEVAAYLRTLIKK